MVNVRRLACAFLIFLLLICSGCIRYQGERPFDYPPAKWVSETPTLWFDVNSPDEYADQRIELEGCLEEFGQSIEIIVTFDYTDRIFIREKGNDDSIAFLEGICDFNPENLIVTVDKKTDSLLNGQYDTITFVKETLEK